MYPCFLAIFDQGELGLPLLTFAAQAHVGIALLSGFGSANAASKPDDAKARPEAAKAASAITAQRDPKVLQAEFAAKVRALKYEYEHDLLLFFGGLSLIRT